LNPWDEDESRRPRQVGWGCLAAVIIGSITTIVAVVIVLKVVASTFPW
jgi:hypothetical protein